MNGNSPYLLVTGVLIGLGLLVLLLLTFTKYRLSRHEVEVLLFGLVIRRVMLTDIDDVVLGNRFPCELWPNWGIASGRFMTIRLKRKVLRYLTITPNNPVELRANIYYALGWNPKG